MASRSIGMAFMPCDAFQGNMKILYLVHEFYPAHHGGTEKFVLQLAQTMQALGHQVKVVTYDNHNRQPLSPPSILAQQPQALKRRIVDRVKHPTLKAWWHRFCNLAPDPVQCYSEDYAGVPVIGFCSRRVAQNSVQLADPHLSDFATALLRREAPDLIHVGYLRRTAEFLHVAQQLQIPYLITLTSYWLICPQHVLVTESGELCYGPRGGKVCKRACPRLDPTVLPTRLAMAKQLLAHASAIVAPSHYLSHLYQRELGALDISYIPYGMALQHLPFNPRPVTTGEPLTFFFAGRLVPEKGLLLLLTAFSRLSSPHVRLHIYGAGRLAETVEQAAQADPRIDYGGVYGNEQVGHLLQKADLVVVPSLWHENLPLIMQEAQTCGVPTLVADVGGMIECVTDGVNGFTFRVGDVADLQAKMQMIIDQPEILNEIKENIRNPKSGQYRVTSLEEEAKLYLAQYEQILKKSGSTVL